MFLWQGKCPSAIGHLIIVGDRKNGEYEFTYVSPLRMSQQERYPERLSGLHQKSTSPARPTKFRLTSQAF